MSTSFCRRLALTEFPSSATFFPLANQGCTCNTNYEREKCEIVTSEGGTSAWGFITGIDKNSID